MVLGKLAFFLLVNWLFCCLHPCLLLHSHFSIAKHANTLRAIPHGCNHLLAWKHLQKPSYSTDLTWAYSSWRPSLSITNSSPPILDTLPGSSGKSCPQKAWLGDITPGCICNWYGFSIDRGRPSRPSQDNEPPYSHVLTQRIILLTKLQSTLSIYVY